MTPDHTPNPTPTTSGAVGAIGVVRARDPGRRRAGRTGAGLSVWATAQTDARTQRRGRYLPASTAHPAKMLPAIAAHAIAAYTVPGDLVIDPMCGIGTTLVEAVHAGRHGLGVEYEPRWARLAAANLDLAHAHAHAQGAPGHAHVVTGDACHLARLHAGLPDTLPQELLGRAALVVTSPPYGRHVHGQVDARPGRGVTKHDYRYAATRRGSGNLAHADTDRLLAGFTTILAAAARLLAPGGHVVVTARPWRDHGHLVDLPSAVLQAGRSAGLVPVERCVALLAGLRGAGLVPRASFFQLTAVRNARDNGIPLHVIAHEDVLVFELAQRPGGSRLPAAPRPGSLTAAATPAAPATPATAAAPMVRVGSRELLVVAG